MSGHDLNLPEGPAAPVRIPHLPALDGLRGAAVAAVVAFHLGLIRGGYLGVDLFFTLSGFLITSLLVAEWRARGRIDLRRFWARRARRLLPALLLVLATVGLATRAWGSTTAFDGIRHDAFATLAYVANWRSVAAGTDYWNLFARPSPLEHTWSLAIEEQFYVLWPLVVVGLVALGRRRSRRPASGAAPAPDAAPAPGGPPGEAEVRTTLTRLLVATVAVAALGGAWALWLERRGADVNRIYFGTDTRVPAILFGAALALAVARFGTVRPGRARAALEVAAVVGGGLLVAAWLLLPGTAPLLYEGGLLVVGLAAVAVLAAAAHPRPGPVARVLGVPPLRWLGLLSYGLYLWHWPVICFLTPGRLAEHGIRLLGPGLVLARVAASLVLAVASYHLLERPLRHGAGHGWPVRLATPLSIAAVVALVAWSTQGGAPAFGDLGGGRNKLRIASTPVPAVDPGRPRLLVVGDSGAWAIQYPMAEVAPARGVDWVDRGTPACGILPGDGRSRQQDGRVITDPPGCGSWPRRWDWYVGRVRPDVALVFTVAPAGAARWVEGAWRRDCDPVFDRHYRDGYERAIRILGSHGARVAVTTVAYLDSASDADGRYPEVDCRNRTIRRVAADTGATLVDLARWACGEDGPCRETVRTLRGDEVELRPDGLHYSGPGGVVATRWVMDRLDLTGSDPS